MPSLQHSTAIRFQELTKATDTKMRIARIIGTVTLNRYHPALQGARLRLAVPLNLENLSGTAEPDMDPIVVYDEMGAGIGSHIALSEGGEAAQPFRPELKPIDAYDAAILDQIHIPQSD